jgi:hypothetical protein
MGANSAVRAAADLKRRVFAKLGVRGYQPYERLGLWLRQDLAPVVRYYLLGRRTLERGVFVPDTLQRVVNDHLEGRRNNTYLILAMMVFEAGLREFVDGESGHVPDVAGPSFQTAGSWGQRPSSLVS